MVDLGSIMCTNVSCTQMLMWGQSTPRYFASSSSTPQHSSATLLYHLFIPLSRNTASLSPVIISCTYNRHCRPLALSFSTRRNGTGTDGGQHWGTEETERALTVASTGARRDGADTDGGQHWGTRKRSGHWRRQPRTRSSTRTVTTERRLLQSTRLV